MDHKQKVMWATHASCPCWAADLLTSIEVHVDPSSCMCIYGCLSLQVRCPGAASCSSRWGPAYEQRAAAWRYGCTNWRRTGCRAQMQRGGLNWFLGEGEYHCCMSLCVMQCHLVTCQFVTWSHVNLSHAWSWGRSCHCAR